MNEVQAEYDLLVGQLAGLDAELVDLQTREDAKRAELAQRRALLAERIRDAYDSDRTSLLELFLSGGTFTDVLAEVSYFVDVGEQDTALAKQIATDQETLAEIHQTVADTRTETNELRQETATQKRDLDQSRTNLLAAKKKLEALEEKTRTELAKQKATFEAVAKNKATARKALAKAEAAQKRLQGRIADLIRRRSAQGRIPSVYNGSLAWPMGGTVTQNFGCTGFGWEPRVGRCAHFHRGIDVVAPMGTPDPRVGRRDRRLHRLELCRRLRPGLDRGHRPQLIADHVVRPHAAAAPERDPDGQPHPGRPDRGLRGQHRPFDRRAPALGGHVPRELRQPATLPLAGTGTARQPRPSGNAAFTERPWSRC